MNKILITGSNGYLARFLIQEMGKHDGLDIYGLVHQKHPDDLVGYYHKIYNCFELLVKEKPKFDYIFHLASTIPYKKENIPNQALIENVGLTYRLITAYPEARILYASSVSVYGNNSEPILTVNSAFDNPNLYGLSKLASEAIIRNTSQYAIIRFSSLIGPRVWTPTFIPMIIQKAVKEKKITLFGDGSRRQNYLDYRDAAELLLLCARLNQNLIGLGCGLQSYSNYEIARRVAELCHAEIFFEGSDPSSSFFYDPTDFYKNIGFKPRYTIEETLKEMVNNV